MVPWFLQASLGVALALVGCNRFGLRVEKTQNEGFKGQESLSESNGKGEGEDSIERKVDFDAPGIPLRKIRRCEAVLRRRIKDVVVVIERSSFTRDHEAIYRTCECLGVQDVWLLEHPPPEKLEKCKTAEELSAIEQAFKLPVPSTKSGICKKVVKFLSLRRFKKAKDFITACRKEKLELWCVHALEREDYNFDFAKTYECEEGVWGNVTKVQDLKIEELPRKVAIVFCADENGFAREVVEEAKVFCQYREERSLCVNVCCALVLNRIAFMKRKLIGDVGNLDRNTLIQLREKFFKILARKSPQKEELFKEYVKKPVKPFGDLRHPDQFRKARVHKRILIKAEAIERERDT